MKTTTIRLFSLIMLAISAVLVGCNSSKTPVTQLKPLSSLNADQQSQKEMAIKAKDELFKTLLGELTKSMAEQGPAKSISVCKTRAPEIAETISAETGVRIGRTSFQLRNEQNQAPDWAAGFVSKRVEEPVEVSLPENSLGV